MFRHGTCARSAPLRGIMHDKRALMTSSSHYYYHYHYYQYYYYYY